MRPNQLTRGPFLAPDAIAAGLLTRDQLRGRSWQRLLPNVYAPADLAMDHLAWCRAAALLLGSRGVLSGHSAALVWGADIVPSGAPVEVTVPRDCRLRVPAELTVVRSELASRDIDRHAALPVTSLVRTGFDLGRRLRLCEAVVGIDALCHVRPLHPADIRAFAADRARWRGSARLAKALLLADPAAESPMETRLRLVLLAGGLPWPQVQLVVCDRHGRFVARVDLAYREHRLAIEYDGDQHRDRATFRRDLRRQNALRACGWTILRFTAADIYGDPGKIVATVRAALTHRC